MHFRQGKSAYYLPGELPFIYPPIFVFVGSWMARALTPVLGWKIYLITSMGSVLGTPLVLAHAYLRRLGWADALTMFLLSPFALTEQVFFGANISSAFYFFALLAGAVGVAQNRWLWFYLVIVLAAAVKVTFLLLLLLPLLAGIGQITSSVVTTSMTCSIYLLQKIMIPGIYQQFRVALFNQTFTARNYGYAPFGVTANLLTRFHVVAYVIPGAIQITFALSILLTMLWLRHRMRSGRVPLRDDRWLALIIIAIVLINPRMFDYDVTTGLVPAYFLLVANWRSPVALLLAAISLSGFFIGHGAIGFLFVLLSGFVVGAGSLATRPVAALAA
jgi:hypothetical protein